MEKQFIVLRCADCGKKRTFSGQDADDIMRAIDKSGWRDTPNEANGNALCPECDKARDDEYANW